MTPKGSSTQIFNHELRSLRRARATKRYKSGKGDGFLAGRTGQITAEKLLDINRQFEQAVIIGLPAFTDRFLEALPDNKLPNQVSVFEH